MIKLRDVVEYLEEKVLGGSYSEEEYRLYSDYIWDGLKVFKKRINKNIIRRLVDEIRAEGGYFDRQPDKQQSAQN